MCLFHKKKEPAAVSALNPPEGGAEGVGAPSFLPVLLGPEKE